jgi:FkbM family methyltransferase
MAVDLNDYNLGNYNVPDNTRNGICFDIGANLGYFTEKYINHFSKIYFIEPQLKLYEHLTNKFKDSSHVVGYNSAVWSESDIDLDIVWHSNNDLGSAAVKGEYINSDWTNNIVSKVKSISLEKMYEIINNANIDYLKVDCETSEYPFLYGKDLSKVNYLGLELHHHMGSDNYNNLVNWILKTHDLVIGNTSYAVEENKEVLFKLK